MRIPKNQGSVLLYVIFLCAFAFAFFAGFQYQTNRLLTISQEDAKKSSDIASLSDSVRSMNAHSPGAANERYSLDSIYRTDDDMVMGIPRGSGREVQFSGSGSTGSMRVSLSSGDPVSVRAIDWQGNSLTGGTATVDAAFSFSRPLSASWKLLIQTLGGYSEVTLQSYDTDQKIPSRAYRLFEKAGTQSRPIWIFHISN